jgi:hypothetical protein
MTSRLLLSDVRAALYTHVVPEDMNSSKFTAALNQVRERIINSGKWKGTIIEVAFDTSRPYITLPREAEALLGLHMVTLPYALQSRWYEYLRTAVGKVDTEKYDPGMAIDMGDHYCTLDDPPLPSAVGVSCSNAADVGLEVNVQGLDVNGNPVYDEEGNLGVTIPLTLSPTKSYLSYQYAFSRITNVSKPLTYGTVSLYSIENNLDVLLSVYAPAETRPQYRRFKLKSTDKPVSGICKLRYLPVISEQDPVIPDNLGALKLSLLALNYEDNNDLDTAEKYWMKTYALLNNQLKESRGAVRHMPNMQFFAGQSNPIPTVM